MVVVWLVHGMERVEKNNGLRLCFLHIVDLILEVQVDCEEAAVIGSFHRDSP